MTTAEAVAAPHVSHSYYWQALSILRPPSGRFPFCWLDELASPTLPGLARVVLDGCSGLAQARQAVQRALRVACHGVPGDQAEAVATQIRLRLQRGHAIHAEAMRQLVESPDYDGVPLPSRQNSLPGLVNSLPQENFGR